MNIQDNGEYGIACLYFKDNENNECCILDSIELIGKPIIRFGRTKSTMRLTQEQVKELIPYLERFIKTGELQ